MKRTIMHWQMIGFAFTSFFGTLLHFLYDWLGGAIWIAPFSGVNESTWEHMKLLFWPMFIFAIAQSFFFRDRKEFWCVKLRGIIIGIALIPILFYIYNGAVGQSPDWINIAIFYISALFVYFYEIRLFDQGKRCCGLNVLPFAGLLVIALLFVVFTFATPEINIFMDPLTGTYGIQ